jgi:hypothetical protein
MKNTEFKKIIKDAVKEAIREEMKDIILEAIRTSKGPSMSIVQESIKPEPPYVNTQPIIDAKDRRLLYDQVLNDTTLSFNSSQVSTFNPQVGYDPANGTLPSGDVDMNQIMGLMSIK